MSEINSIDNNLCEQNVLLFKLSDYDLDFDERKAKFKDYDLVICENCNQKIDNSYPYYCKNCYKKETDEEEKKRMENGKCKECFQANTYYDGCKPCDIKHLQQDFDKWTSGNKDIDKLIQDIQLSHEKLRFNLEWIPYDKFNDIKYLAEGGFAKVYSATWIDGNIIKWKKETNSWKRSKPIKVALKVFNNSSDNISEDFINELNFFKKCNTHINLIRCYGVTKKPNTQNYAIVLQFAKNGSLRSYLDQNFSSLTWFKKFFDMRNISFGLNIIHEINSIHKDLHLGNVLQYRYVTCISDFGFCKPADEKSTKKIYGVMPYMAPEILRGKKYTKKSDIYSLGIIMNEIISIIPPFNDEPHDHYLALDICRGKRPKIRDETPDSLKELIQKCWDAIPENRPSSEEVWREVIDINKCEELPELTYNFTPITKSTTKTTKTKLYETHTQAIYTSRLLNLLNLPEPVNCLNQEGFISSRNTSEVNTECLDCIVTDLNKLDVGHKK